MIQFYKAWIIHSLFSVGKLKTCRGTDTRLMKSDTYIVLYRHTGDSKLLTFSWWTVTVQKWHERPKNEHKIIINFPFFVPPASAINGSIQCPSVPPLPSTHVQRRGRERRSDDVTRRLERPCQWGQKSCQSPPSPQMLKIEAEWGAVLFRKPSW